MLLLTACTKENDNTDNNGYIEPNINGKVFRNENGNLFRVYAERITEDFEKGEVTNTISFKKMLLYEFDWDKDTLIGFRLFNENRSYREFSLSYKEGKIVRLHCVSDGSDTYYIYSNDSLYVTNKADSSELYLIAIMKDGHIVKRPHGIYKTVTTNGQDEKIYYADQFFEYEGNNCVKQIRKYEDGTQEVITYEYHDALYPLRVLPVELGLTSYMMWHNLPRHYTEVASDGWRAEAEYIITKENNGKVEGLDISLHEWYEDSDYSSRMASSYIFDYTTR